MHTHNTGQSRHVQPFHKPHSIIIIIIILQYTARNTHVCVQLQRAISDNDSTIAVLEVRGASAGDGWLRRLHRERGRLMVELKKLVRRAYDNN